MYPHHFLIQKSVNFIVGKILWKMLVLMEIKCYNKIVAL